MVGCRKEDVDWVWAGLGFGGECSSLAEGIGSEMEGGLRFPLKEGAMFAQRVGFGCRLVVAAAAGVVVLSVLGRVF